MTKIAVVIPTLPGKERFVEHAKMLISKQTKKPDFIIVSCKQQGITGNYIDGFEEALRKGAELIICWEYDDYYIPEYIELTYNGWKNAGRPALFGWNETYYLNIKNMRYVHLQHGKHASMMGTALNYAALKNRVQWPSRAFKYLDMHLWKHQNITKKLITPPKVISLGIKHGIGEFGGGGHVLDWPAWKIEKRPDGTTKSRSIDATKLFKDIVAIPSQHFYMDMVLDHYVTEEGNTTDPFLTIITRRYRGKRPNLLSQHDSSKKSLTHQDKIQYIYVDDPIGQGMHRANAVFEKVAPWVKGKYVHLLDDDDFYLYREVVPDLMDKAKGNPEVIYFRMIILNGAFNNIYPSPNVWGRVPIIAQIGGSCFVVRTDMWKKHIHHFNKQRCGDFHFINAVHKDCNKVVWFDKQVCKTGKVSRGAPE